MFNYIYGLFDPSGELRYIGQHTEETRTRMSKSHGGRRILDQFGNMYENVSCASRALILPTSNICAVLKKRLKKTGGYIFRYLEDV
jgi:hypothetical protein